MQGGGTTTNSYSRKVGVQALKKLCAFDQIVFGRPEDTIKQMIFSTFARNWRVAVHVNRTLMIYD